MLQKRDNIIRKFIKDTITRKVSPSIRPWLYILNLLKSYLYIAAVILLLH